MITKNKKQRIVVTGGSGFIGSFLIKKLLGDEKYEIVVIDKFRPAVDVLFVQGNFSDIDAIKEVIKKDDIVIHLACTSFPASSENNMFADAEENILGTLKLLKECANKNIKRFVFFSSGGTVYGDLGIKIAEENSLTNPIGSHGAMKLSIEKYIQVYRRLSGMDYLILRPANPYGNIYIKNRKQGLIDVLINKLINNQVVEVWGDGKITRDYIHINDLIEFVSVCLDCGIKNEILNIGTGVGTSINQVLEIMHEIIPSEKKIVHKNNRDFDIPYNVLNIQKAKKLLNWGPKIELKRGIEICFKAQLKNAKK